MSWIAMPRENVASQGKRRSFGWDGEVCQTKKEFLMGNENENGIS